MSEFHYGKHLGAIQVCYKVDHGSDRPQVTVYEQCRGPIGGNAVGKSLGFGVGDTVSEALSDASLDAIRNMTSYESPR